jgi:hypothetical protein
MPCPTDDILRISLIASDNCDEITRRGKIFWKVATDKRSRHYWMPTKKCNSYGEFN